MNAVFVAIFALTYLLIASRRLRWLPIGRPAGALVGAVLMVAAGGLTPAESFAAIDHDTLVLLFGMMILTVYVERAGLFAWISRHTLARVRHPAVLLGVVSVLAAVLSALLVNDTVCLFLTPFVIAFCRKARLPLGPYLMAIATSSNIGSAATLVGNPQNMIIGSMSGMPFGEFLLRAGPAAAVCTGLNLLLLWLFYRKQLATAPKLDNVALDLEPGAHARWVTIVGISVLVGFFAGFHLGYTALAGVVALVLVDRKEPREALAGVDWTLLVFFASLFIVVQGLVHTGLVDRAWNVADPYLDLGTLPGTAAFTAVIAGGSNIVSNVPMTLLAGPHIASFGDPKLGWVMLAFVSTVAGNLTLLGSVANIIVAERAREHYELGFFEYLRFGVVSTLAVMVVGVPVVWLTAYVLA